MFIWKVMTGLEKKTIGAWALWVVLVWMAPAQADACSCAWNGPFLTVSRDAPLVVIGKIIRHHPGKAPSMDVLVLETLKGGILDSGMVVQMGDGMHCRPTLDVFPPGSKWILALNGPGSKPGKDLAISHCGEFWLRVDNDEVIGSIDGGEKQVKRMPMQEVKNRFLYPRFSEKFSGRIEAGKSFHRSFGSRFELILEPRLTGWEIMVREYGRDENLSRMTPPLHFAPNPREVEGWQFLENPSDCADRPYKAEAGPANPRRFIFSPDVAKKIDGQAAGRAVTDEEIKAMERFGRGVLLIDKFKLTPGKGGCPTIEWMNFSVELESGY
jgi:hypothetical protein